MKKTKEDLEREVAELTEELYTSGVRTRPTMMSAIEERERKAAETIQYIIAECEKETGRPFDLYTPSEFCLYF